MGKQAPNEMNQSSDLIELSELAALCAKELEGPIAQAGSMVQETLEQGGTLFFCGNGGSAADAQHLAAEYVVRFKRARGPLRALALTTDTSVLTAGANDFGFEDVFARQVEALAREGDLLFLHSTSGESENLLRAAAAARIRARKKKTLHALFVWMTWRIALAIPLLI